MTGHAPAYDYAPAPGTDGQAASLPVYVPPSAFLPIMPPPPVPAARLDEVRTPPPGPLGDLAYRFLARVLIIGPPCPTGNGNSRPTALTLPAGHPLAADGPLPVLTRDPDSPPGATGLRQVGTVTSVYRLDPAGAPTEVCTVGTFDLTVRGVPKLVAELTRAADNERPIPVIAQLDNLEYAAEAEGVAESGAPRVLTGWRITGLIIGPGAVTWPGCVIVPDEAIVWCELGGVDYGMRRHHDREVWRTLVMAWRHATATGAPTWDALTRSLNIVGAATTTAVHDQIAGRLFDPADPLTFGVLLARLPAILDQLEGDDAARGGVL